MLGHPRPSLVIVAALAVLTVGCTSKTAAGRPPQPTVQPVAPCVTDDQQRRDGVSTKRPDGRTVDGIVTGQGAVGVVFANEGDNDLCTWQMYAESIARQGYRTALFLYSGTRPDLDVLAFVGALRAKGTQRVFLVGASMGGTAVLGAAAKAQPPVAGVVSVSGAERAAGVNALQAVRTLTVPTLFIAAQYDEPFAKAARRMDKACAAKDKQLAIEFASSHGIALLSDFPQASSLVQSFLKSH
jgi:Dienelactone hydrolase family